MHYWLMKEKFPYHSVSVIYRPQDLGFHVIFSDSVKDMVTERVKQYIQSNEFTFSFVT